MQPQTQTPTAKDFQHPLLATLYEMTEGASSVPVPYADTYEPVCKRMGITLDQYGTNADGKPKVAQWVQWAFKNLKRTEYVESAGRGQWALSPAGVLEAAAGGPPAGERAHTVTPPNLVSSGVLEAAAGGPPAGERAHTVTPPNLVSSVVTGGYSESGYHPDPYIRSLAAQTTPCFGHYSHKSSVCGGCPLQGPCINFLAAALTELVSKLKAEDERDDNSSSDDLGVSLADELAPEAGSTFDWSVWNTDLSNVRSLLAKAESVCPVCRDKIPKGTMAVWLRRLAGSGDLVTARAKLFHYGCCLLQS